uniref:NADH-ubiquinone oxidoreductase chain 4L n=1 Tax=Lutraria rhynchaena TaxID=1380851 RepID=W1I7W0_9BIVA|nr:NADH dehydrogenase subunit 4L [Lutraria rhynchaena]CDL72592.1 NADH dehydrogenase subunit 4L [Lutraria rhynchaena]
MSMMIGFFIFVFGVIFLCGRFSHFLSVLLVFELLTFGAFCWSSTCFVFSFNLVGCYFCLVFLVLSVVEAVMGLSLLVSSSRGLSRVAVKSFSFMGV